MFSIITAYIANIGAFQVNDACFRRIQNLRQKMKKSFARKASKHKPSTSHSTKYKLTFKQSSPQPKLVFLLLPIPH